MRVLLVNDHGTPTGGAELQALAMRDGLRARGHEARLLTSDVAQVPAPVAADATFRGTAREHLQVPLRTANPAAALALHRELRDFRPDVVHLRMYLNQVSPAVLPLLRHVAVVSHVVTFKEVCPRGTKVLPDGRACTFPAGRACLRHRCVTPQSWVFDMAQLRAVRALSGVVDRYVAPSRAVARRLAEVGEHRVDLIPNPVAERAARPPLTGPPLVAYAGRLVPEKGVDVALRAFAAARAAVPDARMLVAGDGPVRGELEQLAAELGVADAVAWTGHLTRGEVEREFDAAWVQVVPGRWEEPFGNVVTEAMVRGTAVVASDAGGPADVVRPGVTGELVPPGDAAALAAALTRVLGDVGLAERQGAAGRAAALAGHTPGAVLDRVESLYRRLLGGRLPAAVREPDGPGGDHG